MKKTTDTEIEAGVIRGSWVLGFPNFFGAVSLGFKGVGFKIMARWVYVEVPR